MHKAAIASSAMLSAKSGQCKSYTETYVNKTYATQNEPATAKMNALNVQFQRAKLDVASDNSSLLSIVKIS